MIFHNIPVFIKKKIIYVKTLKESYPPQKRFNNLTNQYSAHARGWVDGEDTELWQLV